MSLIVIFIIIKIAHDYKQIIKNHGDSYQNDVHADRKLEDS